MISSHDAKTRRINLFAAQILRALENPSMDALLKAFFNDNPLIFVSKNGHCTSYLGAQRGLES